MQLVRHRFHGRQRHRPAAKPPIAVDLPRADSDFWNSYAKYIPQYAKETGINLMTPTNSQNDIAKLVANAQALTARAPRRS